MTDTPDIAALVTVRPLEWSSERNPFTSFYASDWVVTPFGNYYANELAFWFEGKPATPCDGKPAAKAAAQADYTARILAALEPGPGVLALVDALQDAEELAHGMSWAESQIVATWGKAVEAKCRAALAALAPKPGAGT